jgi:N4-gp56 family major capsid protein
MPDVLTTFSTLSSDAPNVHIAREMYRLAERRLVLGRMAKAHEVPQRMGKTLRVVRYKRLALPTSVLSEGVPPDAVALATENVDVTLEQWGIVVLLTDVAEITTTHPALQIAINRTSLAISEVMERELANTLMAGTQVFYPGAVVARSGIGASDKMDTATVLKTTVTLRNLGAAEKMNGLYEGVMSAQSEGDLLAADATFKDVQSGLDTKHFEFARIGVWMGVNWSRGNFLPIFKGVPAPDGAAATAEKAQITAVDGGGTIVSATNFKFAIVARDILTDYERKISQSSANIASAATGNNESYTVVLPTSANYVYDVYMSAAGGSGSLFKVKSRVSGTVTITAAPAGTEATSPVAPADQREVFTAFVSGQDAFGRVSLNGMSLASYLTPPGASYSNPLAQGRKIGTKVMAKFFIIDNNYFARLETASAYSAGLPA